MNVTPRQRQGVKPDSLTPGPAGHFHVESFVPLTLSSQHDQTYCILAWGEPV